MTPRNRRFVLGGALVLSIAAAFAVSGNPNSPPLAEPVARAAHTMPAARTDAKKEHGAGTELAQLKRPAMEVSDTDPFTPKSWFVPPPPPPVQDAKPVAPPLPFSCKGKLGGDDDRQLYYLAKGEESFVVAVGDTFAGSYKLESAREGMLIIKYLPLSVTQILRYGPEP